MSNGIMEKNLPVAESLGSGDKVRIVTNAGNSKQIDASFIGGVLICDMQVAEDDSELSHINESYNDIVSAIQSGVIPILVDNLGTPNVSAYLFVSYYYDTGETHPYIVYFADGIQLVADSATDNLAMLK